MDGDVAKAKLAEGPAACPEEPVVGTGTAVWGTWVNDEGGGKYVMGEAGILALHTRGRGVSAFLYDLADSRNVSGHTRLAHLPSLVAHGYPLIGALSLDHLCAELHHHED